MLRFAARPWYPAMIAFLAAIDLFIVVVPTDIFLVSAVLGQPRRWIAIALTVALGSTVGATLVTLLIHYESDLIMQAFPALFQSTHWGNVEKYIQSYGIYAIFFGAAGPLPLQPFVIVGALSKMPVLELALAMFTGRAAKFLLISWCTSHAPKFLDKIFPASTESLSSAMKTPKI